MREYLEHRYAHHPPVSELRIKRHGQVRFLFAELADIMEDILPPSRETSLCQTTLQQAAMWANAALALYGDQAENSETPPSDPA